MKKTHYILIAICLINFFCICECKKHSVNPVDTLPPATQTGANTFGCLINGKAFTPGGSSLSGPNLECFYQYLIQGTPNGYTFYLNGSDKRNPCNITEVGFGFDSVSMTTGTYPLQLRMDGHGVGGYDLIQCNAQLQGFSTNNHLGGALMLTRFDLNNQIASGIFEFTGINNNGDTIKITDGRFDVQFTE